MTLTPEEVFVRSLWMNVPSEDDVSWVNRLAATPPSDSPLGDYGALIKRMLDCGLSEYEIARFAKIVGYEVIFQNAYLLGDPGAGFTSRSNPENIAWGLFRIDNEAHRPTHQMTCLHEYVLSMDPSGREMRPK